MATNPVFVNPDPLPRFDGEGGSCAAEAFVEEALRRLKHYKLADGAGAEYVLSALTGCARAEILSRPADDRTTGAAILDLIQGEFGDKRDLATLLSTFHGRRQGMAEGVYQYAHALSAAATRANKKQAGSINDGLLRDRFIDGLHPPELRRDLKRFIRGNSTATFLDAKAEALRWMRDDADAEVTVQRILTTTTESAEVEEMRRQMAALTAQTAELQAQLSASQQPQRPAKHQSSNTLRCWWCQQPGHREAECPAKRQYNRRRQHQKPRQPRQYPQQPQQYAPQYVPQPPAFQQPPVFPQPAAFHQPQQSHQGN
nr:hypothetical protein BaRGS_024242 [Batillaria attramentaria]